MMKNNIFTIKYSEITEKRFDPHYHKPFFKNIERKLSKFKISTLGKESINIFSGTTPISGGDAYTNKNDGIAFIRSGDFDSNGNIDFNSTIYIKKNIHNTKMKSSKLIKDDVLFAIVGATIGKVGIYKHNEEANINQAICAIRFDKILPSYVKAFYQTNLGQELINKIKRPVARANLNIQEVSSLPIPLFSIEKQTNIILKMDNGYKLKEEKEKESQEKFDSIDNYLLNELGIVIPSNQKENLNNKISFTKFSKISGQRLDPLYHSGEISGFFKMIKFPLKSLSLFIKHIDSGIGAGKQDQVDKSNGLLQLRPTNFNKYGQLIFRRNIYISQDIKYPRVNINDVLFNNTNSQELVGKTTIISDDLKASFSNHVTRIKVNHDINPKFLWIILNLYQKQKIFYNLCTNWNNQSGIGLDVLKDLKIPVLPMNHQDKIVNKVQNLHEEAKDLKIEANKIYEDSKKEVEKMILGDDL